jgi:hypothetical protein
MRKLSWLLIGIISFLTFGCTTTGALYTWNIEPSSQQTENEYFSVTISPGDYSLNSDSFRAFNLIIKNKTSEDIEIDWNRTLYIENEQTNGGFMFEGILYKDRNNPKQADIIFAGADFKKTIWPNNLVSFYGGNWGHNEIPPGQNGAYVTIKVREKDIREKIILHMTKILVQDVQSQPLGSPKYEDWMGIGVDNTYGPLRVVKVNQNSAAYKIIQQGDIITAVNRRPISDIREYAVTVENLKDSTVLFLISRGGKSYYVTVKPK